MKLADALAQRADLQRRLAQLVSRATQHARTQEGDPPVEEATELLGEYDRLTVELEQLIVRINTQNLATEVESGLSMTAALARRDRLRQQQRLRSELADAAAQGADRHTRSEIRYLPAVDVRALRAEADDLARQARELDIRIQEVNWTTEMA
jgi:hypothetical protein